MKKLLPFLLALFLTANAHAVKVENMTEDTNPGTDSLTYCVDDPSGTPVARSCSFANAAKAMTSTNLIDTADLLYETELDTFAELDAQIADESLVTEDDTETLTNKTINTASNTITIVEADISDLSHTTDTNLTEEEVEDFVGGMLGGTETGISVTYQDGTNDIDFVVDLGASIDISDETNLTCGTNCTLTGDEISVDDAFVLNTGDTLTGKLFTTQLAITGLDCTGNSNGGALTADASGNVSCSDDDGGGGSGDVVTANSTAIDTTANFLDNAIIEFDIADGGAGGPDDITGTLATDAVGHLALADVDTPSDGEILSYQASTNKFEWVADSGGTVNTADIADVSVTQTEFAELETIGATTISANQWSALGGIAETLTSTELDLLDGITTLSGSNTGDNDEVGTKTTGDLCINDGSVVNCTVNTAAELETALDGINVLLETEIDASSELLALMDDETGTGLLVFATSPTFTTSIVMGSADLSEAELEVIDGATLTTTELNYVDGVTSAIQTQMDTKLFNNADDEAGGTIGFPDDEGLDLGTGDDFHIEFDNTATALVIEDGAGNDMVSVTDIGTEGTMAITGTVQIGTLGTNQSVIKMGSDEADDCWAITVTSGGTLETSAVTCAW